MTKLAPAEFAELDAQQQRAYQVSEAQDILDRLAAGDIVTEAEKDFASRILGKVLPEAPTPTGFENTAKGIGDLTTAISDASTNIAGTLGKNLFLTMWPVWVTAIIVVAGLYYWNKAKTP